MLGTAHKLKNQHLHIPQALRCTLMRGWIAYAVLHPLEFPTRFTVTAALHTFGFLPVLLHPAACIVRTVKAVPAYKAAFCSIGRGFVYFSTAPLGESCTDTTIAATAYSVRSAFRLSSRLFPLS